MFYINLVPGHPPKIRIFNLNASDLLESNADSILLSCTYFPDSFQLRYQT